MEMVEGRRTDMTDIFGDEDLRICHELRLSAMSHFDKMSRQMFKKNWMSFYVWKQIFECILLVFDEKVFLLKNRCEAFSNF